jgi:hypothetical protein
MPRVSSAGRRGRPAGGRGVLQDETAHEQLRVRPEQVHEDAATEAFKVVEAQAGLRIAQLRPGGERRRAAEGRAGGQPFGVSQTR